MSNDNGHNHEARAAIQAFVNRYAPFYPNGDHVELIQLAAFPVAVTVHLLYQIWANFGTFVRNGATCKIEALAVNDCIQSNLFRQTGPELFEMDANVRQCLLEDLRANRGKQFVKEELAAFLYQYSRRNTQGNAWKNYYDAQQWAAIMEVDEKAAAEQILSSLAQELQKKNTSRGLGIVNLISALEKDNKQFSGLLKKALNKQDVVPVEPAGITSKRIVLTDEIVDGRTPVRINLPAALSSRLERIVRIDPEVPADDGGNKEGKVYGLFSSFSRDRYQMQARKISDLFIRKQYIPEENVTLLSEPDITDLRNGIDTLLSKLKESDIVIIYFNCAHYPYDALTEKITPPELNDLIRRRFPSGNPDVIFILEAGSIGADWYELERPAFTLLATGSAASNEDKRGLFESVLVTSEKNITYSQIYIKLLEEFASNTPNAGIFHWPHFIPKALNWNQHIFSSLRELPTHELQKLSRNLGRESETVTRMAELNKILEDGAMIVGRERAISYLHVLLVYEEKSTVNCLWILQNEHGFNAANTADIHSRVVLWNEYFPYYAPEQDILELVRSLFEADILFLGLTPELLSGLDLVRWRMIVNICRARKVLVYCVIEEECEWERLDMHKDEVLLDGRTLSDYLKNESPGSFLTAAYKDIETLFRQREIKGHTIKGETYGIFIGINEYMDKQFNLHESVSDAKKMRDTLINAKLLDTENAHLMLDSNATRDNVVKILRERLSAAKSEDTIIFYFSGHSSNQQTNSSLYFHDLDRTSEYTSQAENGIMPDSEFKELIKTARNNPTIILILDTHGGSRHWLDESNPKHFSLMATHLEEMCYELNGTGGMFTEALRECLSKQPHISYINLYQSVLNSFLAFAHDGNQWQTPLFVVHKDHWNDTFLSESIEVPTVTSRSPKTYEELQTRDTLQCLYYSKTEPGAFTFYNKVKFALYEKRVDLEHLDSWSAIDKSFSIHNRFPDMIFIGLKESMYAYEPKYNIEKLLAIADAMQIPVHFILEDESKPDPLLYRSYPLLPADKNPVLSGEDIDKLIHELEAITEPFVRYLKPVEEDFEAWALCIGISRYENLPVLPAGVQNAWRFNDWLSGWVKNKVSPENFHSFTTGSDIRVNKSDIEKTVLRIINDSEKAAGKRVLYIYVCGYVLKNTDRFLLCLAPWSAGRDNEVIDISEYARALSHANFAKVIVLAEYQPIDVFIRWPHKSIPHPLTSSPAPSCFFKVPLKVNDDSPAESSSMMLGGLYGEAALDDTSITTSSLAAYLNKRFELEGIAQYPEISLQNSNTKDFVIAYLASSAKLPDNNRETFKQKWILIVGTGKDRLSQPEWMMSNALARGLAKSGYGIITGGWPGVDAIAAEAYAGQLAEDNVHDEGHLQQILLEKQEPVFTGGLIKRVANETVWYESALTDAYAVIMIGGMGGTFVSYEKAQQANVPVIPIAATGGDAAKAYTELEKSRLLPRHILDELVRRVSNYDDAERIAEKICDLLDEGLTEAHYRLDPA